MTNLAFNAMLFARGKHAAQRRKYTNNPYADHLAEVAGIVATVAHAHPDAQVTIATAWLHDTVEDHGVSVKDLTSRFGAVVAEGVLLLSDLEQGNRAERKAASRLRLAGAPAWVQDIKVADLISNTSSITEHDPKFAVVYLEEKRLLLDVLTKANPALVETALTQCGLIDSDGIGDLSPTGYTDKLFATISSTERLPDESFEFDPTIFI